VLELLAKRFDLPALESEGATLVAIGRTGVIEWTNRAWTEFARANRGEDVLARFGVGQPYLEGIAGPLRGFFEAIFQNALLAGAVSEHDYECSSPEQYRAFRMRVLPIDEHGLLLVHRLRVQQSHDRTPAPPEGPYFRRDGSVVQCSNCRCVRRQDASAWDWVPAWVEAPPPRTSHGLCDLCFGFYWGKLPATESR
jgi:hypothetical protein